MYSDHVRIVIACMAYNHENYIARTLDSFIMQEVNEPFHVYVHDDCSTDNTANIIRQYQEKYPHIIKATLHPKNYYLSEKIAVTKHFLFPSIKAQYVALCEGDDYFISPHKLQKQIDFLDANPDYSICFHQAIRMVDNDRNNCTLFPEQHITMGKTSFDLKDLLECNFIQTNTCMYRWRFNDIDTPQKLIPDEILPTDHFWHLLHAECGKIGFLEEPMSVYNVHSAGLWQEKGRNNQWYINYVFELINFYYEIEKRYSYHCTTAIHNTAMQFILAATEENNKEVTLKFMQKYPTLYQEIIKSLS